MNNRNVAHLWANQSKESGKGSSFFFNGKTIYSYGSHFPIATLFSHPATGESCFLFNAKCYSVSTSRHQSYVLSAASHLTRFNVEQRNLTSNPRNLAELSRWVKDYEEIQNTEAEAAKRRRREDAKRRREASKAHKQALADYPTALEAWRNGGALPALSGQFLVALRLTENGKRIETTKRAVIPSCVARKAWPILSDAVAKETANPAASAWLPFFALPEFNWGDYKGLSLRRVARGSPVSLVVGCHEMPWSEVEGLAEAMGLIPARKATASTSEN